MDRIARVDGQEFAQALEFVLQVALKQPKLSVLEGVLLEVNGRRLTLTASDGEGLQVSRSIPAAAGLDDFSMVLRGRGALEQIASNEGRARVAGELRLTATWGEDLGRILERDGKVKAAGGCVLRIANERGGGSGAYCVVGDPSDAWKKQDKPASFDRQATISGESLALLAGRVVKAPFSKDETRPALAGAHFAKNKAGELLAIITDGHRMTGFRAGFEDGGALRGVTLHKSVWRLLPGLSGRVTVGLAKDGQRSAVWFDDGHATIYARTLEASTGHTFPAAAVDMFEGEDVDAP
jgi:hypothetical protein